jgi:hypothetical protein
MVVPAMLQVAPDHLHFKNSEDVYLRTIYLQDYPREVTANWLRDVLSLDFNLDVSMHLRPLDPHQARSRIDANERELAGTLAAVADDAPSARDLQERLEDIAYAKEEFRNKSKWFQLALYITPYASSPEELERATRAIEGQLAGLFFRSQRSHFREEQAFNSVLPQATDLLKQTRGIPAALGGLPLQRRRPGRARGLPLRSRRHRGDRQVAAGAQPADLGQPPPAGARLERQRQEPQREGKGAGGVDRRLQGGRHRPPRRVLAGGAAL